MQEPMAGGKTQDDSALCRHERYQRLSDLVNGLYGPRKHGFATLKNADGSKLVTDQEELLER